MYPPFPYFGGKYRLAKTIADQLPPHRIYVEVFGGAANVLLRKPRSPVEIYNDRDKSVVSVFRVLQDPNKRARLLEMLYWSPYSRVELNECKKRLHEGTETDEVVRAYLFLVVAHQSSCGDMRRGGWRGVKREKGNVAVSYSQLPDRLREIAERFRGVHIECADFRDIIRRYDGVGTAFYLDPPYVHDTRTAKNSYLMEMSVEEHEELVQLLLTLKGGAVLSGYKHPVYEPLEAVGWRRIEIPTISTASRAGQRSRVECLWVSPPRNGHKMVTDAARTG